MTFRRFLISMATVECSIFQLMRSQNLHRVPLNATPQRFIAKRARRAYSAGLNRPDLVYQLADCLQIEATAVKAVSLLSNTRHFAHKHFSTFLLYLPIILANTKFYYLQTQTLQTTMKCHLK